MIRQSRGLGLKPLKKKWGEEVPIVLQAYHEIQHMFFFKGYGGLLQYEDSCTAEDVILAGMNEHIVCLPMHDSFRVRR